MDSVNDREWYSVYIKGFILTMRLFNHKNLRVPALRSFTFLSKPLAICKIDFMLVLLLGLVLYTYYPGLMAAYCQEIDGPPLKNILPIEEVPSSPSGEGTTIQAAPYKTLSDIETRLYGQTYEEQTLNQRLSRIEKTLLGSPQSGNEPARIAKIQEHLKENSALYATPVGFSNDRSQPIINYLEEKLAQRVYSDDRMENRLRRLELMVFGKTNDTLPTDIRAKKLMYSFPMSVQGIRVAINNGPTPGATGPATSSDFSSTYSSSIDSFPEGKDNPTQKENYFNGIYRLPNGKYLRWLKLPVTIYLKKNGGIKQKAALKAIEMWQEAFPLQTTNDPQQADIILDFDNPGKGAHAAYSLPDNVERKTLLSIHMGSYENLIRQEANSEQGWTRAILHQIGHSLGIWGHSDNPSDIMYPHYFIEMKDMPVSLNSRPITPDDLPDHSHIPSFKLSARDINTLTQIYSMPGEDIKNFLPPSP